jgi:hypothetical protein
MIEPEHNSPTPSESASAAETAPTGDQEQSLEKAKLPNRRGFLGTILKHTLVAAETAYMITPLAYIHSKMDQREEERVVPEVDGYPFTDSAHSLLSSTFRNIGVLHTDAHYARDKEFLSSAIREADIILVESGPYFDRLREEASSLGKETVGIDYYNRYKMWRSLNNSPWIAAAAGGWLGLDYAINYFSENTDLTPKIRQGVARLVGYVSANAAVPSPQTTANFEFAPDRYPVEDMSFMIDARTVKMLHHIQQVASANEGKKILAITGDMHAKGIDIYLEQPALFKAKNWFYDLVYDDYYHRSDANQAM